MFALFSLAVMLVMFLSAQAFAETVTGVATTRSLLAQAKGLPADFEEHFFDVPLAVQVEVDQQLLGEAMILLSRDDLLTLLEFTDKNGSLLPESERDLWADYLKQGVKLGACQQKCPEQLLAVHYNLENSVVSLLTANAERDVEESRYYDLPADGSRGLIVRNRLNLNGGQQGSLGGRLGIDASSSLGNWTQDLNMQLSRMGGAEQKLHYAVYEAYSQREFEGQFLRLGYFTPSAEGLTRQIRTLGASPDTALGVMYGSSDSLAINLATPSVYPIYVTANREGSVEIYRNGLLINTQAVAAGLQSLNTRPLPGGIYEIEVRLIEDGQIISTTPERVYKPNNWRNPDERWRYNLFAGRETNLLSNWAEEDSGNMTAGTSLNYLLHPRVVLGLSGLQVKGNMQYGTSIDWTLADSASLYANLYQTKHYGTGIDLNGLYRYGQGSLVFNHTRAWLDTRNTYETLSDGTRVRKRNVFVGQTSNSSVSLNHRLNPKTNVSARLTHSDGYTRGYGFDLGLTQQSRLFGNDGNWRLSLFDRPASLGTANSRSRGFDFTFSLALGGSDERWSASIGSRTGHNGERDNNTGLTYTRDLKGHLLQSIAATATTDTYGLGLSARASLQNEALNADGFVQRSSYNGKLTGGLNLDNTFAVGGNKMVMSSQHQGQGAGMIVDVESDVDDILLRADDLNGGSTMLHKGRNFIALGAYKNGSVSFDFEGTAAPAAAIQPARTRYHLNRGGVEHRTISVVKTVTVLGRLVDPAGNPLKGHHIINHVSRGVSEVDGFFSMEMNASAPTLQVRKDDTLLCQFRIDPSKAKAENNVLQIGDLLCHPNTLEQWAAH